MAGRAFKASMLGLAVLAVAARPSAQANPANSVTATIDAAFDDAYNLDEDQALQLARHAVALAPNDSSAHRALASMLWLEIIFRRGAVSVDAYLGGLTKDALGLPKPAPDVDAEFKRELGESLDLANAALKRDPHDLGAEFDLGMAYGLQASYAASVDGSTSAAFMSAKHAYDAQETVLDRDPTRVGAGVIVGTYRYLVSSLAIPARMFAYLAGFGGGKERGIALVAAATHDPDSHVEAKTSLVLIYTREGRDRDAEQLVRELATEFPRNRLFVLEDGSALIRAGRFADADAVLTKGLDALPEDPRPRFPGEQAFWLYKRGVARLLLNRPAAAEADLNAALANGPVTWVEGRIQLYLGKVADVTQRRDLALSHYKEAARLSQSVSDQACSDDVDRFTKHPFSLVK